MSWVFLAPLRAHPSFMCGISKPFILAITILSLFVYSGYRKFGFGAEMRSYYQKSSIQERAEMRDLQVLLMDLKRQEYVLRMQLLEDPEDETKWQNLANLYMAQQAPEKALKALDNAQRLRPQDQELQINRLVISAKIKKGQLSLDERQQALVLLEREPDNMFLLNLLAVDSFQRHLFSEAAQFWHRAQSTLKPEQHPESYHLLDKLIQDAKRQNNEAHPNP